MYGIASACQGRLAADAELKYTANGSAWLSFRIAVEGKPRQDGAAAEPPQWVSVSVWGDKAEELHGYGRLVKGAEVYVEGAISLREWEGNDGQRRSSLSLSAWQVQPLGATSIGRKPQAQAQPQQQEHSRPIGQYPQRGRGAYQGITNGQTTRQPNASPAPQPAGRQR